MKNATLKKFRNLRIANMHAFLSLLHSTQFDNCIFSAPVPGVLHYIIWHFGVQAALAALWQAGRRDRRRGNGNTVRCAGRACRTVFFLVRSLIRSLFAFGTSHFSRDASGFLLEPS